MERREKIIVIVLAVIGLALILAGALYFRKTRFLTILSVLGALLVVVPFLFLVVSGKSKVKEVEDRLPDFLRDIVEAEEAGMTITRAIINAARNNYGALSPYVNRMAAQLDWGVSLTRSLEGFAEAVDSHVVRRTVSTVIQAHESGGRMSSVLRAVAESITLIRRIKKEREASVYSQVMQGYMIYFAFLGVIVILNKFLIPIMGGMSTGAAAAKSATTPIAPVQYRNMVLIQSLFAGLAIGKMSEGTVWQGVKHSIVMMAIGYLTFMLVVI